MSQFFLAYFLYVNVNGMISTLIYLFQYRYFDGNLDKLFSECHVINPSKKPRIRPPINTRSSAQDMPCQICYLNFPNSVSVFKTAPYFPVFKHQFTKANQKTILYRWKHIFKTLSHYSASTSHDICNSRALNSPSPPLTWVELRRL